MFGLFARDDRPLGSRGSAAGLVTVACTPRRRRLARWFGIVLADGYANGSRLLAAPAHVDAAYRVRELRIICEGA
jgi:hypothetical protein